MVIGPLESASTRLEQPAYPRCEASTSSTAGSSRSHPYSMEVQVLAVIRAARPQFRSRHDKLAFAVHAFLLAQDYKLVATGAAAQDDSQDFSAPCSEVDPSGWNSLPDSYAFRYQDVAGKRPSLYVKCLVVGSDLLVHWTVPGQPSEPRTASLSTDKYTTEAEGAAQSYQGMGELVRQLQDLFRPAAAPSMASGTAAATAAHAGPTGSHASGWQEEGTDEGGRPGRPEGVGGVGYQPPIIPVGVGGDDVVPLGFRPPGYGPTGPSLPGLMEGPPRRGGGMHVGPGHPMFGPGRTGAGVGMPPGRGSLPPGARYDPINPQGLPGFYPDDFVPPGPGQIHPDVMQPGPGRGADFDNMFG